MRTARPVAVTSPTWTTSARPLSVRLRTENALRTFCSVRFAPGKASLSAETSAPIFRRTSLPLSPSSALSTDIRYGYAVPQTACASSVCPPLAEWKSAWMGLPL